MHQDRLRRATSADVARAAGVSRATVSYVLNDTPHQKIADETRRRVLDAAARLAYAPSAAARTLRSGRSDVVLCLLPDWPMGSQVGSLLGGLSRALAGHGMTFVVHPGADRPTADIWKALTPAAVLAFEDLSDAEVAAMRAAGVALVVALLGRSRMRPGELEVPQQLVGRRQAEYLIAAGHRRLGYAYPDDSRLHNFAVPRLDGVRWVCAERGLAPPVVHTVALAADPAAEAVARWRAGVSAVSGVCAYNDEVALAVLAGLRRHGWTAPGDLAVIGVDDIPAAALSAPALTTVTTDQDALARHLAQTLVGVVAGAAEPISPGAGIVSVVPRASA